MSPNGSQDPVGEPSRRGDGLTVRQQIEETFTTLAQRLGCFVADLDLTQVPPPVVEKARTCLLNGYGIALGGHATSFAPVARRAALALDGERSGGATLLGDGRKTSVDGAALANSALFHGRAQEDTCGAGHFGTIMIPLLTALVEARGLPVARMLPALIAGYEVGGLLESAYGPKTTPAGLRASPLYGTLAAAAASAHLLGLDAGRSAAALANAASFTGGMLQSFADGTDEWRYQVGVAARNGLVATELARAGSRSAPSAFEGRSGFVKAFARSDCDVPALLARLGKEWSVQRVTFKPFPVCAFNQTPVTGALVLRDRLEGRALKQVRVRMNPFETGYAGMDAKGPFDSISGTLMSIPFCIALTLLRGTPSMAAMTTYDDADVNALTDRIDLVTDDSVPVLSCVIEAETAAGARLVQDQRMTVADFSYDWDTDSKLVRRIGAETGVPTAAYDRVETFCREPERAGIAAVLEAFAMLPKPPAN
ncbi:MmgE/PrpD family protein [Caenimonas sedimenti]|uniref:MmgE/PrpD family protein n=1 Tax=Caenimonas sedimenti TaxID=2596921 RepID=UPI00210416D3|nr:MmgE/PrpD family protein [Caenimonas sedimenti]